MTLRTLVLLAPLILSACAGPAIRPGTVSPTDPAMQAAPPAIGSIESIDGTSARVLRRYHAASGRLCLDVELAGRVPSERIACRNGVGDWSLRRSLAGPDDLAGAS